MHSHDDDKHYFDYFNIGHHMISPFCAKHWGRLITTYQGVCECCIDMIDVYMMNNYDPT